MKKEPITTYPALKSPPQSETPTAYGGLVMAEEEEILVKLVPERDEIPPPNSADLLAEFACEV